MYLSMYGVSEAAWGTLKQHTESIQRPSWMNSLRGFDRQTLPMPSLLRMRVPSVSVSSSVLIAAVNTFVSRWRRQPVDNGCISAIPLLYFPSCSRKRFPYRNVESPFSFLDSDGTSLIDFLFWHNMRLTFLSFACHIHVTAIIIDLLSYRSAWWIDLRDSSSMSGTEPSITVTAASIQAYYPCRAVSSRLARKHEKCGHETSRSLQQFLHAERIDGDSRRICSK